MGRTPHRPHDWLTSVSRHCRSDLRKRADPSVVSVQRIMSLVTSTTRTALARPSQVTSSILERLMEARDLPIWIV